VHVAGFLHPGGRAREDPGGHQGAAGGDVTQPEPGVAGGGPRHGVRRTPVLYPYPGRVYGLTGELCVACRTPVLYPYPGRVYCLTGKIRKRATTLYRIDKCFLSVFWDNSIKVATNELSDCLITPHFLN